MKNLIFSLFIIVCLLQILVPSKMIFDSEKTIQKGEEFLFKIEFRDPGDPFRGQYIRLSFPNEIYPITNPSQWDDNRNAFVYLTRDSAGFAQIDTVTCNPLSSSQPFIETPISYISKGSAPQLHLNFPFDRYYMNEKEAPKADHIFFKSIRDTTKTIVADVYVLNGQAVLNDVKIDGISIDELVKKSDAP